MLSEHTDAASTGKHEEHSSVCTQSPSGLCMQTSLHVQLRKSRNKSLICRQRTGIWYPMFGGHHKASLGTAGRSKLSYAASCLARPLDFSLFGFSLCSMISYVASCLARSLDFSLWVFSVVHTICYVASCLARPLNFSSLRTPRPSLSF